MPENIWWEQEEKTFEEIRNRAFRAHFLSASRILMDLE
jgi:hypothetical protein